MLHGMVQWLADHRFVRSAVDAGFGWYAANRIARLDHLDAPKAQEHTLRKRIQRAAATRFGRDHEFARIAGIRDYQSQVPLRRYEDFWRDYWQPGFPFLQGTTCPDPIRYLALSSGTTSGTTKYIPISNAMLRSNQTAALTSLAWLRAFDPSIELFAGQLFFLGGSTSLQPAGGKSGAKHWPHMGDLSGIVAKEVSDWVRPFTFPPLDLALLTDWEAKLDRLARECLHRPITLISGVPSWLLILFERVRQLSGKETLAEVWPTLRVVVHGGTRFDPYRSLFRELLGENRIHLLETYPASEAFIAAEDPRYGLLRLIPDHGVFFEFVPVAELDSTSPTRHTVGEIETNTQYAVVLSTGSGLWSYVLGDTVTFECRDRLLLRFTGRTQQFLSAFGEHLISDEVEWAIAAAADSTGAAVTDFHVGPVFPGQSSAAGWHRYLVEFAREPISLEAFTHRLDAELSDRNEDYRAHRVADLTIGPPEVISVPRGTFADWMRSRGKLGGQHKVPRLDNTGAIAEELQDWAGAHSGHDLSRVS